MFKRVSLCQAYTLYVKYDKLACIHVYFSNSWSIHLKRMPYATLSFPKQHCAFISYIECCK